MASKIKSGAKSYKHFIESIMPIKYSFTPSALINTYNRKIMTKVAELFESSSQRDHVLLADCGSWLVQDAGMDRSGFYMTIRLHPLAKHLEAVQAEGQVIIGKFLALFYGRNASGTFYEDHDKYLEGENMTVYVETSSRTIGD